VPGRKSGQLRSTPVSPRTVDGQHYVTVGLAEANGVKNACGQLGILAMVAAGTCGSLRAASRAARPILRAGTRELPPGVQFFQQLYHLPKDEAALPKAFAALAPHYVVSRAEALPATHQRTSSA